MQASPWSDARPDSILVHGLELSVHLGVPDSERAEPQRLTVNLTLFPCESLAQLGDDLARTVDYYTLTRRVRQVAGERPRKLVETLAEEICVCVLAEFSVAAVEVELRKYILADAEFVAVRLFRANKRS
jgi:FolB domain-containing protein